MSDLILERKDQDNETGELAGGTVLIAPIVDEEYWAYRVRLSDTQAIIGFPKYTTIGIGFAVEEDWNSNLPYVESAEGIFGHIAHNKGDDSISDEDCLEAIRMIQAAVREDRG
jgi:hypothetical protein